MPIWAIILIPIFCFIALRLALDFGHALTESRENVPALDVDYYAIAKMEQQIWGQTFHSDKPWCRCNTCRNIPAYRQPLPKQTYITLKPAPLPDAEWQDVEYPTDDW